jgi:hypothetical protein
MSWKMAQIARAERRHAGTPSAASQSLSQAMGVPGGETTGDTGQRTRPTLRRDDAECRIGESWWLDLVERLVRQVGDQRRQQRMREREREQTQPIRNFVVHRNDDVRAHRSVGRDDGVPSRSASSIVVFAYKMCFISFVVSSSGANVS